MDYVQFYLNTYYTSCCFVNIVDKLRLYWICIRYVRDGNTAPWHCYICSQVAIGPTWILYRTCFLRHDMFHDLTNRHLASNCYFDLLPVFRH